MNYSEGDVILLNNNKEYVIVNNVKYQNKDYFVLLSLDETQEFKIVNMMSDYNPPILNENVSQEVIDAILDIILNEE